MSLQQSHQLLIGHTTNSAHIYKSNTISIKLAHFPLFIPKKERASTHMQEDYSKYCLSSAQKVLRRLTNWEVWQMKVTSTNTVKVFVFFLI